MNQEKITALTSESGHQFVFYGDACSGVAGAPHEETFGATNKVIQRLEPPPEFIIFAGDEIRGLTADENELRSQWRYWHEVEMDWLDRSQTPIYHCTSNHTTYNEMSERVFSDVLGLPRNGPNDQQGLSYFVRRDDLLMVFVHTSWSGLGGEGHLEVDWLGRVLHAHQDAAYKFVIGHHPVFPVNGYAGRYQLEIGREYVQPFWQLLVKYDVFAYLCSHILAFDVQLHDGVLQLLSGGAGTAHRMPEGIEYLHCVQGVIDSTGLRYQVVDQTGRAKERLNWPMPRVGTNDWNSCKPGQNQRNQLGITAEPVPITIFRFNCAIPLRRSGQEQTLLAGHAKQETLPIVWIGLTGEQQVLTVTLSPTAGRSPQYWFGPPLSEERPEEFYVAFHRHMGPGGILYKLGEHGAWNSLESATPLGIGKLELPEIWYVGLGQNGTTPFRGDRLDVACTSILI